MVFQEIKTYLWKCDKCNKEITTQGIFPERPQELKLENKKNPFSMFEVDRDICKDCLNENNSSQD